VPLVTLWPWRQTLCDPTSLHDVLTTELCNQILGTFPGGPTGPGGVYRPGDLSIPELLAAQLSVQAARFPHAALGA
jgi:hypothetical protein